MPSEVKTISEANTLDPVTDDADCKAAVIEHIAQIDHIRQQMAEDQKQIDRLKVETREILARLEAA